VFVHAHSLTPGTLISVEPSNQAVRFFLFLEFDNKPVEKVLIKIGLVV